MKLVVLALALVGATAFTPTRVGRIVRKSTAMQNNPNIITDAGSDWKPDGGGAYAGQLDMGSTDTPDFFEENDESGVAAAAASAGASTTKKEANDALAQALQSDSWTIGGVEKSSDRPKWFDGNPMSVPDGTLEFKVANEEYEAVIMNGAMGFEDFYADLSEGTTGNFEIEPQSGTLNKRGGEPQVITVRWKGGAGAGGHLVVQSEEEKWSYELKLPN